MVQQKDINLGEPLDINNPPTIGGTNLTPELATVSLNLHIESHRQAHSVVNKRIFWNYRTFTIIFLVVSVYSWFKLGDLILNSPPNTLTISFLKYELAGILIVIGMTVATLAIAIARLTDDITEYSESLAKDSTQLYGFNISSFAKLSKENKSDAGKIAKLGANSQLILYRQSPISIVTLVHVPELSNDDQFVVKITGLAVRKVYVKSGLYADLLDWSMYRARIMLNEFEKSSTRPIKLIIDVYSFDNYLKDILIDRNFNYIKSEKYNGMLGSTYGVARETWGAGLITSKTEKLPIVDKSTSSGISNSKLKKKSKK